MSQSTARAARGCAACRPRRQPPAADDHEDVVMLRRAFRAMGTDVELLLDAAPGERSERALDRAEAEFERLEQVMSRFRDDSELSALNRDGSARAGLAPTSSGSCELALDGPRGDRRPLRSHRPRRRRGGGLRPRFRVRAGRRGRPARRRGRADGNRLRRPRPRGRRLDRARARASSSISAGSVRATRPTAPPKCSPSAGPCLVNVGRRHRGPRRLLANRGHRRDHARAHRRRHGDLGPRSAALAARR